jgi:hypothetical protein
MPSHCTPHVRRSASPRPQKIVANLHPLLYTHRQRKIAGKVAAVVCIIVPMKRINFYLSDEQVAGLHAVAAQRGIPASELLRRFIDDGLARLREAQKREKSPSLEDLQRQIDTLRTALGVPHAPEDPQG